MYPVLLRPKSRGFIKLRTTSPYDPPIIDPRYEVSSLNSNKRERRITIRALHSDLKLFALQIFNAP